MLTDSGDGTSSSAPATTNRMPNQVFRNVISSYLSRFAGLLGMIVLVPLYTRFLGHRLYGEWLVITTIATYLVMANMGIDQTLVNRIAEAVARGRRSEVQTLISTAFFAYTGIALVMIGAFAFLAQRLSSLLIAGSGGRASLPLFVIASLYGLALPWSAYSAALRGFERVDQEQAIATCVNLGRSGGLALALISGLRLVPLALIHSGAEVLRGLLAYARALPLLGHARPRLSGFCIGTLRSLMQPSLGFFVLQIAGVVGFGIDNLVIGYALGPGAVTNYAVPYSLVMIPGSFFATAIAAVLPTITSNFARPNHEDLGGQFLLGMRFAMVFATISVLLLSIAGPLILHFWAGPNVFPGLTTFRWQLALLFLQVFIGPPYAVLVAGTRHYGVAALHVVESLLNLVLSLWWVHRWGLSGVIAGSVVARSLTSAWFIPLTALATLRIELGVALRRLWLAAAVAFAVSTGAILFGLSARTIFPPIEVVAASLAALVFVLVFACLSFGREVQRDLFKRIARARSFQQTS
jgi:O-antigen/teichoic acid export membrane protein